MGSIARIKTLTGETVYRVRFNGKQETFDSHAAAVRWLDDQRQWTASAQIFFGPTI